MVPKYKNIDLIFKDRSSAGELLAENLTSYNLQNPLVVALPRGGIPVAKPIAKQLQANLDIIVAKKIGAPNNPELAVGAVTSHGDYVISSYTSGVFDQLTFQGEKKWDYLQNQIVYLINDCKEREKRYKEINFPDSSINNLYEGKSIILVDDGIATGMTALAAIKSIKKQNPIHLILAIPVISFEAFNEITTHINKIETLKIPREFVAVGIHYKNFNPVTDDEIKELLV